MQRYKIFTYPPNVFVKKFDRKKKENVYTAKKAITIYSFDA